MIYTSAVHVEELYCSSQSVWIKKSYYAVCKDSASESDWYSFSAEHAIST